MCVPRAVTSRGFEMGQHYAVMLVNH